MSVDCPDENVLAEWALGACPRSQHHDVERHVASCSRCAASIGVLTRVSRRDAGTPLCGKYEVVRPLGAGGMGEVVLARHLRLKTNVALKFLRQALANDPEVAARFEREARAASRLRSEHTCRVFDFERDDEGNSFIAMEYLEGESLEARRRRGPVDERTVIEWTRQALAALDEAHLHGVVHRDLKPANLFLARRPDGSERVVVLDYGLAKSTNPEIEEGLNDTTRGKFIGSPAFMSPEQLTPRAPIDHRTDVWSLGCTMFVLIAGEPPFRGGDLFEVAHQIRNGAPAPLPASTSRALRECVARCLEKSPGARYQTAKELSAALSQMTSVRPQSRGRALIPVALAALLGAGVVLATRPEPDVLTGPAERPAANVIPPPTARSSEPADEPSVAPSPPTATVRSPAPAAPAASPKALPVRELIERPTPRAEVPDAIVAPPQSSNEEASVDAGTDDIYERRL